MEKNRRQGTDEELYMLSDGGLALIRNTNEAMKLVSDGKSIEVLGDTLTEYKELNKKICDLLKQNGVDCMIDITIYKDTFTLEYEGDDNLMIVKVSEECIRRYVTEICKANYDEWIKSYTADDTEGLFNFVIMNDYKYELEEY